MPRLTLLACSSALLLVLVLAGADPSTGVAEPEGLGYTFASVGRPLQREVPPTQETGETAAIIGVDERVQITDTDLAPWSSIAFLELYIGEFLMGECTGTFIGPDTVLTAAHCLYDPLSGWTENIAVVPGKDGDDEPFGFDFASNWWVPALYIETGGSDLFDWGVIKMPTQDLGNTVGWLTVGNLTTETLSRDDFNPAIVGYPGDVPFGTMWGGHADAFLAVDDFLLEYTIDTAAGQSGAAIFSANVDEWFVAHMVGIHTLGGLTNVGQRIDAVILADIDTACVVMDCSYSYFVEIESESVPTATSLPPTSAAPPPPNPTQPPPPLVPPEPEPAIGPTVSVTSFRTYVGEVASVDIEVLNIDDPGLGAWTVDTSYNPDILSIMDCSAASGGVCNPNFSGDTFRITGASPGGILGDVTLGTLTVRCVAEGAGSFSLSRTLLADATIGDPQAIDAQLRAGTVVCESPVLVSILVGDANCDGMVNAIDASLILQLDAALISELPCPAGGDASGDSATNALDAALVLQFSAGMLDSLPP